MAGLGGNVHGKGAYLSIDTLAGTLADVSRLLRSANLNQTADRPVTRTFGANARRTKLGLIDAGTIAIAGEWRKTALVDVHGKATRVLIGRYSIAPDLRSMVMRRNIEIPVLSTFPDGGVNFVRRPVFGAQDGSLNFSGYFNATAGRTDEVFTSLKDSVAAAIVSVAPEGFTIGNLVDMGKFQLTSYAINTGTEAPVEVSADMASDDQQDTGVSLKDDLSAETTTDATVNNASVNETAQTLLGWVAHLHVKTYSGFTSVTVKIQDSADDSAWADVAGAGFTLASGVTEQRLEGAVAATVRQYVRSVITTVGSGSVNYAVAFARRGFVSPVAATHRHITGLLARAATTSFEYGPEGNATGAHKKSGEVRLQSLEITYPVDGDVEFSAELVVDGAITNGVFA